MREIDKLDDNTRYKVKIDMLGFYDAGTKLTGKQIKEQCPFDVSERETWKAFFKKL